VSTLKKKWSTSDLAVGSVRYGSQTQNDPVDIWNAILGEGRLLALAESKLESPSLPSPDAWLKYARDPDVTKRLSCSRTRGRRRRSRQGRGHPCAEASATALGLEVSLAKPTRSAGSAERVAATMASRSEHARPAKPWCC